VTDRLSSATPTFSCTREGSDPWDESLETSAQIRIMVVHDRHLLVPVSTPSPPLSRTWMSLVISPTLALKNRPRNLCRDSKPAGFEELVSVAVRPAVTTFGGLKGSGKGQQVTSMGFDQYPLVSTDCSRLQSDRNQTL
jgi:hypothetical protein